MSVEKKFEFKVTDFPNYSFEVVRFSGEEGISRCYFFEIDLVAREKDVDIDGILESPAQFKIKRTDRDNIFNGYIKEFYQFREYNEYAYYRAVLAPRLWWLEQYCYSQLFLNKNVEEFLTEILRNGGLLENDFEFRLTESYESHDYVCQYNETHLNFFHRWLEAEGLYYFFEQDISAKKLVVIDSDMQHTILPGISDLEYLQEGGTSDIVNSFFGVQRRIHQFLRLRNYHYSRPSQPIDEEIEIDQSEGLGMLYHYGDGFQNDSQAVRLANFRKQAEECKKRLFQGQSTVSCLKSGYLINLINHYRADFNQEYLITRVYHEGSQTSYLSSGLSIDLKDMEKENYYRNEFDAIPSSLQYRSESVTKKPKIYGFISARIDAEGDGEYAELDEQGRYRVVMPFDISGPSPAKGSVPLRMMQPYGGPPVNSDPTGMHFPLRKGTEVLVAFIDGDIDRPVIAGAVPNELSPSVVKRDNQKLPQIVTPAGNRLVFNDDKDNEAILLSTSRNNSFILLGEASEDSLVNMGASASANLSADASVNIGADASVNISAGVALNLVSATADATIFGASAEFYGGAKASAMIGETFGFYLGLSQSVYAGSSNSLYLGQKFELSLASRTGFSGYKMEFTGQTTELEAKHNELVGAVQKLSASHSDLAGKHDSLVAQCSELKASANELAAKHNELVGQCTKLKGSTNGIEGTKVDISGSATKLGGNATELKANETKLSSVSNAVSGLTTIV
jgi:type VI secretion system secreted protein VgrG